MLGIQTPQEGTAMMRSYITGVALSLLALLLAGCGGEAGNAAHTEAPCETACTASRSCGSEDGSEESSAHQHGVGCDHSTDASAPAHSEEPSAHQHGDGCDHSTDATGAVYCGEHDLYEAECGICQPGLACELKPGEGLKIRLPSEESESKARIVSEHPRRGPTRTSVVAVGQLEFDQNRLVHITPLADGVVRRVFAELGDRVGRGEVLAELTSFGIADAKAELLTALADEEVSSEALSRERELFDKGMSSTRHLQDAEARHTAASASLRAAEQRLLELGLDRRALERTVSEQEVSSVLPLTAPFDGTVIERDAVVGDLAAVGDRMFTVADLRILWVTLAVSERDVARLRVGQPVVISSATLTREIDGEITWISSHLDETTRMAEVRAEVPNPDGSLRAGMFVDASITIGESLESLLVPRDTVYSFEGNPFVFVRLESDLYELRRVQTGYDSGDMAVVTAGLSDEDLVAVDQSYLLKSEFQKSRFGVGCAH
jgi:cobalt-zinc-cadmium efflux system membrane fusion protein